MKFSDIAFKTTKIGAGLYTLLAIFDKTGSDKIATNRLSIGFSITKTVNGKWALQSTTLDINYELPTKTDCVYCATETIKDMFKFGDIIAWRTDDHICISYQHDNYTCVAIKERGYYWHTCAFDGKGRRGFSPCSTSIYQALKSGVDLVNGMKKYD